MTYASQDARRELLDTVAEAVDELAGAIAALGAAYEQLDDASADRLEEALFRPMQLAYGRLKRTHDGFAERYRLAGREFGAGSPGPARGAQAGVDRAVAAVGEADHILTVLQDSMRPVEVGDAELRAGLAEVRELIAPLPERAREFSRTLGR